MSTSEEDVVADATQTTPAKRRPSGEYAIVEVMGHRTIVGRVSEVERFGASLMSIEPIFQGCLLDAVLIGGSSIYQFTPCSADTAFDRAPDSLWSLPASVRCIVPPAMLPAPCDTEEEPF